jgi:hypothetical protein
MKLIENVTVPGFTNTYDEVLKAHVMQQLTESGKDGVAYRKGLRMCEVTEEDGVITFNAMRCASSFCGPTEGLNQ